MSALLSTDSAGTKDCWIWRHVWHIVCIVLCGWHFVCSHQSPSHISSVLFVHHTNSTDLMPAVGFLSSGVSIKGNCSFQVYNLYTTWTRLARRHADQLLIVWCQHQGNLLNENEWEAQNKHLSLRTFFWTQKSLYFDVFPCISSWIPKNRIYSLNLVWKVQSF